MRVSIHVLDVHTKCLTKENKKGIIIILCYRAEFVLSSFLYHIRYFILLKNANSSFTSVFQIALILLFTQICGILLPKWF